MNPERALQDELRGVPLREDRRVSMGQAEREAILIGIFRRARTLRAGRRTNVCLRLIAGKGPRDLQAMLDQLDGPWFDYAVASIYSLLLPQERRKRLGAYFTPPHLVSHLMARMEDAGLDLLVHRVHDPAAGGAAFVVPLVDAVADQLLRSGLSHRAVLRELRARLSGVEIDKGLARIANALVRRTLQARHGLKCGTSFELIRVGDSLKNPVRQVDAVVGNPPYAKVGAVNQRRWAQMFPDILGGQLNLYAMFMRRSLDQVPDGGLSGFIVPTSFIGGPEFSRFRVALVANADVLTIDLIEKRTGLFLDVVQDACFVVFRRSVSRAATRSVKPAICSLLSADGEIVRLGAIVPPSDGSAWTIPSPDDVGCGGYRLRDYGYNCRVGYLVANRQRDRIRTEPGPGRLPLIEASCIRADGTLVHASGRRQWVSAFEDSSGVVRQPAVAIQRTSNRKQKRRINAAPVPYELVNAYGGFVGENHVILLIAEREALLPPEAMARLLNSGPVNEKYGRMCGTISLSAKLLSQLDLPNPDLLVSLRTCDASEVDWLIQDAYRRSHLGRDVEAAICQQQSSGSEQASSHISRSRTEPATAC
jgi:adenine-specific DNA-methyltransferase